VNISSGQVSIVKDLSQIATKGLPVLVGTFIERLSKLSVAPEEVVEAPPTSTLGAPSNGTTRR
jgi:hypothetical protein